MNKIALTLIFFSITTFCKPIHAEIETFDMSLSGDFKKDYCSIWHYRSYTNRKVNLYDGVATTTSNLDGEEYIYLGRRYYRIKCSQGTYDVRIETSNETAELKGNARYSVSGGIYEGFYCPGASRRRSSFVDSANAFETSFTSDGVSYCNAQFTMATFIRPEDGKFQNLPDRYNHTSSFTLTIEPSD
tara:strand:+ start:16362 stop:16922 length:561 start_codon:yes stop_codon:yes gene_type:complete